MSNGENNTNPRWNEPTEKRSGYASGVSPISSPRADTRGFGKSRIRRSDGTAEFGIPPVHGAPAGQPQPPSIGPNEYHGPADRRR
jgi:hypothetical protein